MSSATTVATDHTRVYLAVFAALVVLTVATVSASYLADHLTRAQAIAVGVTIAGAKALCVMMAFMHLRHETRVFYVAAFFPFVLFLVLVLFILGDLARWIHAT